jgi:hypothetical protein
MADGAARSYQAFSLVFALFLALVLLVGADHLVASSRAGNACEAFQPGMDGTQVNVLVSELPGTPGLLKVRGDPAYMMALPPARPSREEFMQFAIVYKGLFFSARQCVVSVKAGRVENSHVVQADAYVMLNPVQTVRAQGGGLR